MYSWGGHPSSCWWPKRMTKKKIKRALLGSLILIFKKKRFKSFEDGICDCNTTYVFSNSFFALEGNRNTSLSFYRDTFHRVDDRGRLYTGDGKQIVKIWRNCLVKIPQYPNAYIFFFFFLLSGPRAPSYRTLAALRKSATSTGLDLNSESAATLPGENFPFGRTLCLSPPQSRELLG